MARRETLCVLAAILIFGLGMNGLGLVPAAVPVASGAALQRGLVWRLVVAAVINALTWAIFSVGLRLAIPVRPA